MTLDVYAICYNEEFMLPLFISHYKAMGANITIYDNLSTDNSKEIIINSGCTYIPYDSGGQIRDDLYLDIKNNCWKKSTAEWVAIVDIDEFIELQPSLKLDKSTMVRTKGYDMIGAPPSRNGVPNNMYSKYCMFRPKQIREINYRAGCHTCSPVGNIFVSEETANLLHYKYISKEYVFNRHTVYESRLSDINKRFSWGIEYQNVIKEDIEKKIDDLTCLAIKI